jgi:hypothetical protein
VTRCGLIGAALIALSACANQKLTQGSCVVAHESGFVDAGGGEERITVAENGSPCVIAAAIKQSSMGKGEITTPPSHGTATLRTTAEATLISYIPAREYVGEDRFAVAFGPNFNVTVFVQIVPITTGSAVPP